MRRLSSTFMRTRTVLLQYETHSNYNLLDCRGSADGRWIRSQAEEVGEEAVEAVGGANPQRLLEQSETALSGLDDNTRLALQVPLLPSVATHCLSLWMNKT